MLTIMNNPSQIEQRFLIDAGTLKMRVTELV